MSKRAKTEYVFINHLGKPVYTTEDEMKENYIKLLLVPWFIIAKRYGIPKDIVKMITKMFGRGYCDCPIWQTIISHRNPHIPMRNGARMKISSRSNSNIIIKHGENFFNFYVDLLKDHDYSECSLENGTITITFLQGKQTLTFWFKGTATTITTEVTKEFDMNKILNDE